MSPAPSDRVLSDIPHVEGLMYNTIYAYLFLIQFPYSYAGLSHVYFPVLIWLTQEDSYLHSFD